MPAIATIITDMLNRYDHEDAEPLAEHVSETIQPLQQLIENSKSDDVMLVYVNDNYDDFTATSDDLIRNALNGEHPELVGPIAPPEDTYFVQKVRHSAFYSSTLDHLLRLHDIETVVLAGQVLEQCVLYSALDAYVRGFHVRIPDDAVAPIDPELGDAALRMMESNMDAVVAPAAKILD